jgi:hypothetical protein
MRRPQSRRRRSAALRAPAAFALCALALCLGSASAQADAEIERVWSFNGGAVDVVAQSNGTLTGIVTAPTKFASCVHSVGEQMWTEMRLQPDGSYWGLHHWFFEAPACVSNPTFGPTAWRVLQNSAHEAYLRVCFSEPGSPEQPTIAADGSSAHVTYGCANSASIAPLPTAPPEEGKGAPFKKAVVLPPTKACVQSRTLKIHLHEPKYDPLRRVIVWVDGHKAADIHIHSTKQLNRGITLRKLPPGAYKIKVTAITVLGHRLSGSHAYNGCAGSSKIKLGGKKHKKHKQDKHG